MVTSFAELEGFDVSDLVSTPAFPLVPDGVESVAGFFVPDSAFPLLVLPEVSGFATPDDSPASAVVSSFVASASSSGASSVSSESGELT
ncbi:hypothetical protein D3C74_403530 [compost metagenome]